ncbi:unnamed protein product, partial [Symbiodinium natans]
LLDAFVIQQLALKGIRAHLCLVVFWVGIGLGFNVFIFLRHGAVAGVEWCSGYILEWLLSLDNLFVFHLIFQLYKTPSQVVHKALFLGIIGAVVCRLAFFAVVRQLLDFVSWLRIAFGFFLVWSGIQAAQEEEESEAVDTTSVQALRWLLGNQLLDNYGKDAGSLVMWIDGKMFFTLMLPVVCCLEITDVVFALDSVSAKAAQIPDYWVSVSSSILAMFALRAMFFVVQDFVSMFEMLKYGLCCILVFIGIELMISDYVVLPPQAVCVVILSVFIISIVGSAALHSHGEAGELLQSPMDRDFAFPSLGCWIVNAGVSVSISTVVPTAYDEEDESSLCLDFGTSSEVQEKRGRLPDASGWSDTMVPLPWLHAVDESEMVSEVIVKEIAILTNAGERAGRTCESSKVLTQVVVPASSNPVGVFQSHRYDDMRQGSPLVFGRLWLLAVYQAQDAVPAVVSDVFSLLCPTYAVKWKEQQGLGTDGTSNWSARWPVMRDILQQGRFDVLCLQEVEVTELESIVADLGSEYQANYFKHARRPPDGLLIAVKRSTFKEAQWKVGEYQGFAVGGVDLEHPCGAKVRVVNGHMKGGRPAQLQAFADFASAESSADVEILTADFNEDFAEQGRSEGIIRCPFAQDDRRHYFTLSRALDLPQVSRPPNKQEEGQSSGKGKIDYIWVRERTKEFQAALVSDPLSRRAIIDSHRSCDVTGDWPSDHGCEAFSVQLRPRL